MGNSVPDYKETIRQEWTGAAPLWQRWNPKFVVQTRAATDLVIDGADLAPGMHVLDLASGTGEPSLSIASAVGPTGRVCALSNNMAMPILGDEHYVLAVGSPGDRDQRGWETDLLAGLGLDGPGR